MRRPLLHLRQLLERDTSQLDPDVPEAEPDGTTTRELGRAVVGAKRRGGPPTASAANPLALRVVDDRVGRAGPATTPATASVAPATTAQRPQQPPAAPARLPHRGEAPRAGIFREPLADAVARTLGSFHRRDEAFPGGAVPAVEAFDSPRGARSQNERAAAVEVVAAAASAAAGIGQAETPRVSAERRRDAVVALPPVGERSPKIVAGGDRTGVDTERERCRARGVRRNGRGPLPRAVRTRRRQSAVGLLAHQSPIRLVPSASSLLAARGVGREQRELVDAEAVRVGGRRLVEGGATASAPASFRPAAAAAVR
mmetsp:Transcript_38188/g.81492  ORF Transcript_38188/g.81492 Transcript_38188/m.81492 type:complete len:313 (+) Transcript_38188:406-1344(+)